MSLVADNDGRKSFMKMLLSSPLISVQTSTTTPSLSLGGEFNASLSGFPSPMSESASDELIPSISNFIYNLSSFSFEESTGSANSIVMEHSYSRAWNWRPETNSIKPARNLLVHKPPACPGCHEDSEDPYVDVDGPLSPPPPLPYDVDKGRMSMNEVENHLSHHLRKCEDGDWEDKIDRKHWSINENAYYVRVRAILHEDLIARLTVENHRNEPVLRRSIVDRSVSKFRRAFNSIGWDIKTLQWMHNLLIDNLNKKLLSVYIDILQGLKSKLPALVDKLMFSSVIRSGAISYESLYDLVKKPWNPLDENIINSKIKKIPNNPIIFVCPSCPQVNSVLPSRYQQLMTFLNAMATVENVSLNLGFSSARLTLTQIVEHMLASSRTRLQEIKTEYPDRPIVLLGFHSGASLAFQIAQTETVTCIVCIGFDIHTAEGMRGTPDDIILNIPYPVLFIMGENSVRSHPEEVENLREKMSAETSLIIIGSADDSLRLSYNKKILEGVTQSMVDRCIMDEIADYVTSILLNPYPDVKHQATNFIPNHKLTSIKKQFRTRKISKRRFSNSSLFDTDTKIEPVTKRPRPVGRPKGSISKNKITPQARNTTLQSINNPPHGGITITMGSLCSSPSKIKSDESSGVSVCNLSLNNSVGMTTINLTPQNNHMKHNRNTIKELNDVQQQDIIDKAVLSILPENFDNSSERKVLTPMNNPETRNDLPKILSDKIPSTKIDLSKYKLSQLVATPSSSKILLSANNLNSIHRGHTTSKYVKMCLPSSQVSESSKSLEVNNHHRIRKSPAIDKTLSDQLAGTNILDLPIIFADNDGNINESLKIEDNQSNLLHVASKPGKSAIKMIVVNKQSSNYSVNKLNVKNSVNSGTNQNLALTNNSGYKYPKILLRRSSMQNNLKLNTLPQKCLSTPIDFKNVDLESELVANKVLKTISPVVKQTTSVDSDVAPACNSDIKNKILLTVGSKMSVFKNSLNKDIKKPIIIKPGAQIKAIPMIKAQNILNKNFTMKKNNTACNFTGGQKMSVQQVNSKDHSNA